MTTLKELKEQRAALDQEIKKIEEIERNEAIIQAKLLISQNGLTQQDLFGGGAKKAKANTEGKAMYRDPISGNLWNGHGRAPKGIAESGKDKSEFLIAKET